MAKTDKLVLRKKPASAAAAASAPPPWPVLVVDDDEQVHAMTRVLLRDFEYQGRGFEMISATSAAEAADILADRPDIPVCLLDVVMESPDAGLKLVHQIRNALGNRRIRIILRTGQPGEAPERDVVLRCDINDYRSKADLTAAKLFTALVGALRAWHDIVTIGRLNAELMELNASLEARVVERTAQLEAARQQAQDALAAEQEAKRQQRQFLSMVSHEFRTPLAIIDSAAQMLVLRAEDADPAMLPRLDSIRGGVQRLIALIDTCLADEQLESGRMVLAEREYDLGRLAEQAVTAQRAAHPARQFLFEPRELPASWGDPGLLALVVNNLVGNAVKYSPQGGPVAVEVWADGDGLGLSVADPGIGIPADDLGRIFDRFFRAGNTRGISGSGIGLHMVRQIIELHGGHVQVDSVAGAGSRFTVRLPVKSGPA